MSLTSFYQADNYLPHIFLIILLSLGYFNSVLIAEPVSIFFQISSLTGQLIVNKFLAVCSFIFDILKLICSFLQIVYEDSLIFVKDAIDKIVFGIYLLKEVYLFLEEFGSNVLNTAYSALISFFNLLQFLQCTLGAIKQGLRHTGSAIWCFFADIPKFLISSISAFNEFIKNTIIEIETCVNELQQKANNSLKNAYLFFFDIPFDSVSGLIIGAVLLTILIVKFKTICCITSKIVFKLFQRTTSVIISIWKGSFLELGRRRYVEHMVDSDERLCIVCQFGLKEIILFPCKHLCLCVDCSRKVMTTQAMCPLCRVNITGTLKVYV